MSPGRVDYDQVAPTYDARYRSGGAPPGVVECVRAVAAGAKRVLEAGCGTGHWLPQIASRAGFVCGLDRSGGMLEKARATALPLVQGDACVLPFRDASFEALYCINAVHHFPAAHEFLVEARRVLRPGGGIAIVGMDPSAGLDRWYLYDFFPGTLDADRKRYPPAARVADWMAGLGFGSIENGIAARLAGEYRGCGVYSDPILSRHGTSQLSLLSEEAFAAGMARIESAIAGDAARRFVTDVSFAAVTARR